MTWIYYQKTGHLYFNNRFIGTGYSGFGLGLNNPDYEGMSQIGVIPHGRYHIKQIAGGNLREHDMIELAPLVFKNGGLMHHVIRGENWQRNGALAIVLAYEIRQDIAASRDLSLMVMR